MTATHTQTHTAARVSIPDTKAGIRADTMAGNTPTGTLLVRGVCPDEIPVLWSMLEEFARFEGTVASFSLEQAVLHDALFGPGAPLRGVIAWVGDTPVGCALTYGTFSSFRGVRRLFVEDLFVAPAGRGQGVGKALLGAIARQAKAMGCDGVQWRVHAWNKAAIEFYAAVGAAPVLSHMQCLLDGERMAAATSW